MNVKPNFQQLFSLTFFEILFPNPTFNLRNSTSTFNKKLNKKNYHLLQTFQHTLYVKNVNIDILNIFVARNKIIKLGKHNNFKIIIKI